MQSFKILISHLSCIYKKKKIISRKIEKSILMSLYDRDTLQGAELPMNNSLR